jgi:hypothetical protein
VNWTELLKKDIEIAYHSAGKLLDKVDPDSLDWKPATGNNWMTVGQLLKHLTQGCGAGCKGFVTGDWAVPEGESMDGLPPADRLPAIGSIEETKKLLLADKALALQMVDQAGENDLDTRKVAAPWAPGMEASLGWFLRMMVQHLDLHKAQLFYYLKLQGKPVNTGDLWG